MVRRPFPHLPRLWSTPSAHCEGIGGVRELLADCKGCRRGLRVVPLAFSPFFFSVWVAETYFRLGLFLASMSKQPPTTPPPSIPRRFMFSVTPCGLALGTGCRSCGIILWPLRLRVPGGFDGTGSTPGVLVWPSLVGWETHLREKSPRCKLGRVKGRVLADLSCRTWAVLGRPQVDTFTLAGFSPGLSLYVYNKDVRVEGIFFGLSERKPKKETRRLGPAVNPSGFGPRRPFLNPRSL